MFLYIFNYISLRPGCAIQGVQTRTGTSGVQRDRPHTQEVRGEGVYPEQEGDSPQEAVARVQKCHETELCHKLGDGQLWKSGNNGQAYFVYFMKSELDSLIP